MLLLLPPCTSAMSLGPPLIRFLVGAGGCWRSPGLPASAHRARTPALSILVAFPELPPVKCCLSSTEGPRLYAVLSMWSNKCWVKGNNHFFQSTGRASPWPGSAQPVSLQGVCRPQVWGFAFVAAGFYGVLQVLTWTVDGCCCPQTGLLDTTVSQGFCCLISLAFRYALLAGRGVREEYMVQNAILGRLQCLLCIILV